MRRAITCCGLLLLSCYSAFCQPQEKASFTPDDVEAAYLYNFGKFAQWPSTTAANSQSFSICMLGQDNFGKKLDDIVAGESIQGRRVEAVHLSSIEAADQCQIVFIGHSEESRLSKDLEVLGKKPVLTVSTIPGFLERGGIIQFVIQSNKVRFAVNLPASRQAGLSLSSELLKVAVSVTTNAPQEDKQ
jgi:hypothetical protein